MIVLINFRNILTTVLLGVTDTSNGTGSLYYTVDKENTIIHPFYNNLRFTNDIALLRLPAEVPLNGKTLETLKYC